MGQQHISQDLHPPAPKDFFSFTLSSVFCRTTLCMILRSKCSQSVYWYIQGFPLVPLELTSDSRDILAERRYLSTKSQSASTASWMSALYRREYLVENLLLYCIDISLSICFWHQGHLCWILNFSSGEATTSSFSSTSSSSWSWWSWWSWWSSLFSSGQQLHCSEGRWHRGVHDERGIRCLNVPEVHTVGQDNEWWWWWRDR